MKRSTIFGLAAALAFTAGNAFAATVNYTVDPAAGSKLYAISEVTVFFPDGEMVGFNDVRPAVATLENTTTGNVWYCETPGINRADANGVRSLTLEFGELGGSPVEITELGDYVLSIRGLYTSTIDDEGEESEPTDLDTIEVNYTIEYPFDFTLDPASDAELNEITTITLTFEPGAVVGYYDSVRPAVGVLENITTGNVWYCEVPGMGYTGEGGKYFTFDFSELGESDNTVTVNEPGEYTFSVHGLYTSTVVDGEEGEPEDLPVITANYLLVYPVEYTFDPENGSTLKEINKIVLSFDKADNVGIDTDVTPAVATLENLVTGSLYYSSVPEMNPRAEGGKVTYTFEFSELLGNPDDFVAITINEPGDYKLSIRGIYTSTVDDAGEVSEPTYLAPIVGYYTIEYPILYSLTPAPGEELEEISEIVLTFTENPNVGIVEDLTEAPVTLVNDADPSVVYYCDFPMKNREEDGSTSFTFKFTEESGAEEPTNATITEDGIYHLTVKYLYQTVEITADEEEINESLPDLYATYIVSSNAGVAKFFNDDNTYNVYGVNGVQYVKNGDASSLGSLAPGLYIINGKKVIIRK